MKDFVLLPHGLKLSIVSFLKHSLIKVFTNSNYYKDILDVLCDPLYYSDKRANQIFKNVKEIAM